MTCTICQSTKSTVAYYGQIRGGDVGTILQCSDCGVQYLENMREADYTKSYRETVGADDTRHLDNMLSFAATKDKVVLDIGCSSGIYLSSIEARQKIGIEPNKEQRDNSKVECIASIEDALEKYEGKIDIVTMWHVIEHISHPVEFLRDAARLLISGGEMCISTPNVQGVNLLLVDAYAPFFYRAWHTHYYNKAALLNVSQMADLYYSGCYSLHSFGLGNLYSWLERGLPFGNQYMLGEAADNNWKAILDSGDYGDTLYMRLNKREVLQ